MFVRPHCAREEGGGATTYGGCPCGCSHRMLPSFARCCIAAHTAIALVLQLSSLQYMQIPVQTLTRSAVTVSPRSMRCNRHWRKGIGSDGRPINFVFMVIPRGQDQEERWPFTTNEVKLSALSPDFCIYAYLHSASHTWFSLGALVFGLLA